MKQSHVIRIETQGDSGRLMVNICSDYLGQKISIPIEHAGSPSGTRAITTAKLHLEKIGYTFSTYCPGKHGIHYLVSDNFHPLK